MTDQPTANQVIRAAIGAAGGATKVGEALGVTHAAVCGWLERSSVPARHILPLCEAGGNVIKPEQILAAMARNERSAA